MTNGENNWGVSWAAIEFFQRVLATHTSVESYKRVNHIQFEIVRRGDLSEVNAVLLDCYMLGEAIVYAILEEFENVTAVVNNGSWNHIALDWRKFAEQTGVVVLEMADFLGALNVEQLDRYTTREEREEHRRKYKASS